MKSAFLILFCYPTMLPPFVLSIPICWWILSIISNFLYIWVFIRGFSHNILLSKNTFSMFFNFIFISTVVEFYAVKFQLYIMVQLKKLYKIIVICFFVRRFEMKDIFSNCCLTFYIGILENINLATERMFLFLVDKFFSCQQNRIKDYQFSILSEQTQNSTFLVMIILP